MLAHQNQLPVSLLILSLGQRYRALTLRSRCWVAGERRGEPASGRRYASFVDNRLGSPSTSPPPGTKRIRPQETDPHTNHTTEKQPFTSIQRSAHGRTAVRASSA